MDGDFLRGPQDTKMQDSIAIPKHESIPASQKICYGLGGLSDFFIQNIVQALAVPIFAVGMKLDPMILGMVMAATKIVSGIADPVVGIISDRTRSRWGRRKPFILCSGILSALILPFIWTVPNVADPIQLAGMSLSPESIKFIYIFVTMSAYFFLHSMFAVPYNALGYEMSHNYDEKTKIFAWKSYIGIAGILMGVWFYWFTMRPWFANEMEGAMWLGVMAGALVIMGTLAVTRGTKEIAERGELEKENKVPAMEALKTTFSNRSFLYIQGALLVMTLGIGVDATIGMYLHVHYTCLGDKVLASEIGGIGGTIGTAVIPVALGFSVWVARRWGKREASIVGMVILLLGVVNIPWLINPSLPYLVIVVWVFSQFGSQCSNMVYGAMVSDICDEDELNTGKRREGSYAAAGSLLNKAMQVIVLLVSGFMPRLSGYTDTSVDPTVEQLESMKWWICGTDVIGVVIAIFFLSLYPLSRKRCTAIKEELEARKNKHDPESAEG
jgi:GPH family glycoside/pentoside/hexuronide:cation symporter